LFNLKEDQISVLTRRIETSEGATSSAKDKIHGLEVQDALTRYTIEALSNSELKPTGATPDEISIKK